MQVKVFSSKGDAPVLETEINAWLKKNENVQVSHVKQSYASDGQGVFYILMSVWYTVTLPESSPI